MATTRPRVNLILTDWEEERLRQLTVEDSDYRRLLESRFPDMKPGTIVEGQINSELVHMVLTIGMDTMEDEQAAASYAAEAADHGPEREAMILEMQKRSAAAAARHAE